jgi:glycosyltransferase involved in cell wall biosynthesis
LYVLPIHVPIYTDRDRLFLTTEWHRSLLLLRDALAGRFPEVTVIAPRLPASEARNYGQSLMPADREPGLKLVPSFEMKGRARDYWLTLRNQWKADLTPYLSQAEVVHAGLDDLYRPIAYSAFRLAVEMDKPTIFVQDTDIAHQSRQLPGSFGAKLKRRIYARLYERACRKSVRVADLSLLKGNRLMEKYGPDARWAQKFHDTSHSERSVLGSEKLEERLKRSEAGPLRLVYMGRFVSRKGVDHSVDIVHRARGLGADVVLDLIGDGPDRAALEAQVDRLGLKGQVKFLGQQTYGPEFLKTLSETYDALLFTPLAEDTPRMIFDGYAAGLPLLAYGIDYCKERAQEEGATLLLPAGDPAGAAKAVADLALRRKERLPALSRKAREAGLEHSAENWYRKRTEWTIEAIRRHQSGARR